MATSLNLSLTDELRRYVDSRASDSDLYATPSEYIRDLIRRDMQEWSVVNDVVRGLQEMRRGELVDQSIMEIYDED
ncbi:MAG: hypothetical protein WD873_09110 [Candidatus Hydrogenedentales bacterium]